MKPPEEGSTSITGKMSSLLHELPMLMPSRGSKPPIPGFTRSTALTSDLDHMFPIELPSTGSKPPIPGLTRTTGITFDLLQLTPNAAPIARPLTPTTNGAVTAKIRIFLSKVLTEFPPSVTLRHPTVAELEERYRPRHGTKGQPLSPLTSQPASE